MLLLELVLRRWLDPRANWSWCFVSRFKNSSIVSQRFRDVELSRIHNIDRLWRPLFIYSTDPLQIFWYSSTSTSLLFNCQTTYRFFVTLQLLWILGDPHYTHYRDQYRMCCPLAPLTWLTDHWIRLAFKCHGHGSDLMRCLGLFTY